jgi:hypothetical protein
MIASWSEVCMDAARFDALARSLTDRRSRRTAFGLTLGGVVVALTSSDLSAKKYKKKCKKKCGPCRKCKHGKCKPKPNGTPCGASTHGGATIRCCNGACPDPGCVPSGETGDSCAIDADCAAIDCCAQQGTTCEPDSICFCFFAEAGEPCGSDLDCSIAAGSSTACICGTCQAPPS